MFSHATHPHFKPILSEIRNMGKLLHVQLQRVQLRWFSGKFFCCFFLHFIFFSIVAICDIVHDFEPIQSLC